MDKHLKVSSHYLTRYKISAELPELGTTLFKVKDGLTDSEFLNLFLDLLKNIDKDNYTKLMMNINNYKSRYNAKTLQDLLDTEPVLLDDFYDKALNLIDANSPKGYSFGIKGENRYGFWEE